MRAQKFTKTFEKFEKIPMVFLGKFFENGPHTTTTEFFIVIPLQLGGGFEFHITVLKKSRVPITRPPGTDDMQWPPIQEHHGSGKTTC
jgi:hypothetical protein